MDYINRIKQFLINFFKDKEVNIDNDSILDNSYSEHGNSTKTTKTTKRFGRVIIVEEKVIDEKSKKINIELLNLKIKNNIFYLEELIIQLEEFNQYKVYLDKLKDLNHQSKGNLKILFKMKKDAPYFFATAKVIVEHTNTVSSLMKVTY